MTARLYRTVRPKGEITVFLALITGLLTGLAVALTQSARLQMIRMFIEAIMDEGLHSCFGEYDQKLYQRYDLLYIDTSYRGSTEAGIESLLGHLSQYMTENSDLCDTPATIDWYKQSINDAQAPEYTLASDNEGEAFKRQASGYIEKYGGYKYASVTGAAIPDNMGDNDFLSEWDEILLNIDSYGLPLTNPGKIVRGMVLSEDEFIKNGALGAIGIDIPSKRSLRQGTGLRDSKETYPDQAFIEYIMQKCGCYTEYKDEQLLTAELEYIVYGRMSDRENMHLVINELLRLRESDNLRCIKGDGGKVSQAYEKAYEVVAYNTLTVPDPELVKLVRDSIIYAWAYAESAVDVSRLLNKGRCPLSKGGGDIRVTLEELINFGSLLGGSGGSGLSYKELIGLYVVCIGDRLRRIRCMDIIECNMRTFYNEGFRIDGCVEYLCADVFLSGQFGGEHTIKRKYSYE